MSPICTFVKGVCMNSNFILNKKQLTLLMSNLLITKMTFSFPRFLFKTCGNAAWIQAIYMSLLAYIILNISFIFYKKTGNRSIIQLSESIGKKPLKIAVSLLISFIIIIHTSTEMRTFLESAKIILLPKTKIEYLLIFFSATVTVGVFCGFNALTTINSLFFPFCLFFLGALVVFLIPTYNINNIFPIFGTGIKNIFANGVFDLHCFSDLIALNLLLPYIGDIKTAKESGKRAVIISGTVLTIICLAYALTYPYPYSSEFLLIPYQLSRMVRAGEYFQRFEALFEFVWTLTHLLYSAIYVYILCLVFQSSFKLREAKSLLPCVVVLLSLISFLPSSVVELLDTSNKLKVYMAPLALLLPIIIPLIYTIKNSKRGGMSK